MVDVTSTDDLRPVFGQVVVGSIGQLRGQVRSVPQCSSCRFVVSNYSITHVTPFRPTELSQAGLIVDEYEGDGQCGFTFALRAQICCWLAILAAMHQT